jgi:hypothetical protein
VEDYVRFQHHHERDFELLNFVLSADVLFKRWLNHENNADFKALYDSRSANEQQKLMEHLYSPFVIMNDISKRNKPGESWDFRSANISIYNYPSTLGQGWISTIIVLAIQIVIPGALLYGALVQSPRFGDGTLLEFSTTGEKFCTKTGNVASLIVNFCVIIFYAIRQVPMILYTFFETAGEADTTRSRLTSLRTAVWELGRDTFLMQVGYKLDKYMSSWYIGVVNSLMLFVTFLQTDPVEIILNAIAIEFVVYFGREVATSIWLDPSTRYIRAGGIELVMRSIIDTRALSNIDTFSRKFDVPKGELREAFSKDGYNVKSCLSNSALAAVDDQDVKFFDPKNQVWKLAERYATKSRNHQAIWLFRETTSRFDQFSRWLSLFGLGGEPVLRRFESFHTWSRWEKVLFMSPCTNVVDGAEKIYRPPRLASTIAEEALALTDNPTVKDAYLNDTYESDMDVYTRFILDIIAVMTFKTMFRSLHNAIKQRSPIGFIFRLVDGIFEWFAYLYLMIFPLTLIGSAILLFVCY